MLCQLTFMAGIKIYHLPVVYDFGTGVCVLSLDEYEYCAWNDNQACIFLFFLIVQII
jgi:hypothetical protein